MYNKISLYVLNIFFLILFIIIQLCSNDNTYPGAFVFINPSAESVLLGSVYSILIPDPSGIFNNPANIGELSRKTLQSSYFLMPFDTDFYYLSFTYPLREKRKQNSKTSLNFSPDKRKSKNRFKLRQAISIGYSSLIVRNIEKRDIYGNLTGIDQDNESMFALGYSRNVYHNNLFFGMDMKYYFSNIIYAKSYAYIFDLGLNYRPENKFILGLVIKNIFGKINWSFNDIYTSLAMEKSETIPFSIIFGGGYLISEKIFLALDLEYGDRNLKYYFGSKYQVSKILEICAGYNKSAISFGFNFGNYKSKLLLSRISYAAKLGLPGNNIFHLLTISICL